ncbi:nuclear transport factor 2 family protein [Erythrobacter rubeus]|uniref:Nuclear transport factor 2 family protein n=1 Tax=Erythrobacter rubeus TaxID=2760803 RepID=A0ABR8KW14_9SPHN|nr:nuclear transport factor 2 family protein [Erythrobacter rubeus]MBD2842396.1 nuclear transport factor 2 family protein [Erythrobacter rubeus]
MIENWRKWIAAFDKAVGADDWDALRPLMSENVTYTVSGVPFACHLIGINAVLAGFRKSIANFDKHFDQRWWFGVGVREFAPNVVCARAMGVYRLGDLPLLHFSAPSTWRFEDGKVAAMQDCYDVAEGDVQDALAWLGEHAPELDASYN